MAVLTKKEKIMLYGREDSDNGNIVIEDDEPVFVLRAKDELAPFIVHMWAEMVRVSGGDQATIDSANAQAQAMRKWGLLNGRKLPDV